MNKFIIVLGMCVAFCKAAKSQIVMDRHWDIKAHEVGQLHFQLGVGVPTPQWNADSNTLEMKTIRIENGAFEKYKGEDLYTLFGAGPVYLRFEYGFTRRLSINAGITYTNYKVRFSRDSIDATIGKMIPWEYGVIANNIASMARLNYHMYIDTRWDVYVGGGLGYDGYKSSSYTKYPPLINKWNGYFKNPSPVTFETSAGFRYFFLNRCAWYLDIGYGKTYVNTGVIVKVSQPKLNRGY